MVPAIAQPPQNPAEGIQKPVPFPPVPQHQGTPQELLTKDVNSFFGRLNGVSPYFQTEHLIYKARIGFFGANEWNRWWSVFRDKETLALTDLKIEKQDAETASVRLTYTLTYKKQDEPPQVRTFTEGPFALRFAESKFFSADGLPQTTKFWQFEPQVPNDKETLWNAPLRWAIYMMAQPPDARERFHGALALARLGALNLAVLQFVQDYNVHFALDADGAEDALNPYMHKEDNWIVPGTQERYAFNARLSDLDTARVARPDTTILFYDGADEKPVFRFGGKTAVGFADGHVALVTAEEFGKLRWKP